MARPIVLILGGYGVFGRRIAANLARREEIDLVIAGRNAAAAAALARTFGAGRARSLAVDMAQPAAVSTLLAVKPAIVVDTFGPFQTRNLTLPRSCAGRGIHYVDISDARARAAEMASLDAVARVEHAAIVTGASTLPAFSTAIVDELAPNPREVVSIDVGVAPGHLAPRGVATVSAILSYCGKEIPPICGDRESYGWGDLTRFAYPQPVGERWLSNVDTPERALWRTRYPALEEADVRAGFEISILHLALFRTLARCAARRTAVAAALRQAFSQDCGGLRLAWDRYRSDACTSRHARQACALGDSHRHPWSPRPATARKFPRRPPRWS
jgi:hypothetical protein